MWWSMPDCCFLHVTEIIKQLLKFPVRHQKGVRIKKLFKQPLSAHNRICVYATLSATKGTGTFTKKNNLLSYPKIERHFDK